MQIFSHLAILSLSTTALLCRASSLGASTDDLKQCNDPEHPMLFDMDGQFAERKEKTVDLEPRDPTEDADGEEEEEDEEEYEEEEKSYENGSEGFEVFNFELDESDHQEDAGDKVYNRWHPMGRNADVSKRVSLEEAEQRIFDLTYVERGSKSHAKYLFRTKHVAVSSTRCNQNTMQEKQNNVPVTLRLSKPKNVLNPAPESDDSEGRAKVFGTRGGDDLWVNKVVSKVPLINEDLHVLIDKHINPFEVAPPKVKHSIL